jgi:uncharacterized protein (UPF0332 family)
MTIEDKKRELALNRIKQAEESLEEAEYLFDGKKSPRSVINRAYYAMFYAILALLIFEKFSSSKHSGVLSYFNFHFVKTGKIPKELGRAVNKAFDMRLRGDYREQAILTREQVAPYLDQAKNFIDAVKTYLKIPDESEIR